MEAALRSLRDYEARNPADVAAAMAAEPPTLLENVHLHDYQLEGLRWLLTKYAQGLNPILGDEMGLGKTLQVIAFLTSLMEKSDPKSSEGSRFLIVAPLSVVPNWVEQFGAFAPSVNVVMYAGSKDERLVIQDKIKHTNSSESMVVVTSYETLLSDLIFFGAIKWGVLILDEGHRLKNRKGLLYASLQTKLRISRKMLLSGTPIQNDLSELFALLSLMNPQIFDDEKAFEDSFKNYFSAKAQVLKDAAPREKGYIAAEAKMRQLLSPLLLLRTVRDVNSSFTLPPISEIVVHTPMAPMQREYYREIVAKNSDALNGVAGNRGSKVSLINILPQLRKACNHPYLFAGAEPEPFCEGAHIYENSGKLYVLHHLLPKLRDGGHCVLLFSQSPPFLDIIQDYLTFEGFSYERIDGSVRGKERWQAIERFRSSPDTFVFLISTRCGGVGLNLQRADTVIFVDSDYNPQADLQAVARAYRLGQTKPIHVIKFACANTVEEIVYRRALKKMRMADKIRDCAREEGKAGSEEEEDADETKESLVELIQFGLHRLLDTNDERVALTEPLDESYVNHILTRNTILSETSRDHLAENLDDAAGDVQEENMYYFDGEDYSTSEAKAKDALLLQQICLKGEVRRKKGPLTRRKRYTGEEDEDEESDDTLAIDPEQLALDEAEKERKRRERQRQAQEKKLAKWRRNNYSTMVIEDPASAPAVDKDCNSPPIDRTVRLRFLAGDASRPSAPKHDTSPFIIVHCVDTSGVWSTRGFFRSLSVLSPRIQQQYEAAARNDDLKLGQAHLIQIRSATDADDDDLPPPANGLVAAATSRRDVYACLLVVQGFVSSSKAAKRQKVTTALVRTGKSTQFRLHALQRALSALSQRALALHASVHMPRIGYGTPGFNWYAVERIIKRELSEKGVAANIYYFSPGRRPAGP